VFQPSRLYAVVCLTVFASCGRIAERHTVQAGLAAHRGSVWVVDKPGRPGRLYLCGTIHILRAEDYPLAKGYEAAYADSAKLVLELPPGAGEDNALTSRMTELGSYPKGESLQSHVSAGTWKAVQDWAGRRNVPIASLQGMRPWFLSLVISATEYGLLGAKADRGVDQHFETLAKKEGKPGEGLETPEFQLQLFTQLSEPQQADLLEQTLGEVKTLPEEYQKMITAWKDGDLPTLHEMLFREAEKFPELMDLFLNDRNRAWLKPLSAMLERGEKAMVLVGTGHLAGDTGLIRLLQAKGYRVRHFVEFSAGKGEL
jgi:uncharacterized protein YbaP (TraB family)